uniref:Uncharacterized protein n=1 Tax=viral metagenome TaxID=1070528 RepID=A0A6M3ITR5_9ZZZZ
MEDGDNEGVESYMKGGYDTVCTECNGLRVVLNPVLPDHVQKEIDEYCRCEREDVAYAAQERRMMGV